MKTRHHYDYHWQKFYFDAVSDPRAATVHSKIALARAALDERIAEILTAKGNNAERQAIVDALFSLRFLELHSRNLIRVVH